MAYKWLLVVSPDAQAQIDGLSRNDLLLVFDKIKDLLNADDPTDKTAVTDIKRLKAPEYEGWWRKRAGDWRILYRVQPGHIVYLNWEYQGQLVVEAVVNRRDL